MISASLPSSQPQPGFSAQLTLPAPVLAELKALLDARKISSAELADHVDQLTAELTPSYETTYGISLTKPAELAALVLSDAMAYLQEKEQHAGPNIEQFDGAQ